MRWEERLLAVLDDLELQAEGLALADRDAGVAEQRRAEYAQVDLASRLHGSVGSRLLLGVTGVGQLDAELRRAGAGWCLLGAGVREWVVRLDAVTSVRGLGDRAVSAAARPITARLGLASALRGITESRADVVLHRLDGSPVHGVLGRVGADFVELRRTADAGVEGGSVDVVPFTAMAAVSSG